MVPTCCMDVGIWVWIMDIHTSFMLFLPIQFYKEDLEGMKKKRYLHRHFTNEIL